MFDLLKRERQNMLVENQTDKTNPGTVIIDNDQLMLLESLEVEEQALLQEKADLLCIEEKLLRKLKEEIKNREEKISELKKAILTLKQRCETMANALGIKIQE